MLTKINKREITLLSS